MAPHRLDPHQGFDRAQMLERMVDEHARFLYRVAYSLLRHPQDAEDAVQDALLKLAKSDAWSSMADERAYLARVVWRAALDRRAARTVSVEEPDAALGIVDGRPTPEHAAAQQDERSLLRELIEALPEELRQPLVLSAMEEMSSREIGEVMGIPEGTVRTRLMRARNELKQSYESLQAAGREVAAGGGSRR